MLAASRWVAIALIGFYLALNTLESLTMTIIRSSGRVPDTAPVEQAAYFLSIPWGVILLSWLALGLYVAALALIVFRRAWATRALGAAVAVDLGSWLWARTATTYADVFTPTEQALEALLFLLLISVIVLMIVERQRDSLT